MVLFEDLEDGDELKQLLTIKTRVDKRIEHLIQASTHDYVGVSMENWRSNAIWGPSLSAPSQSLSSGRNSTLVKFCRRLERFD